MAKYVVVKDSGGEVNTELYYQYHLEDALTFRDYKQGAEGGSWFIAEVIPEDSWVIKLYLWFKKRGY